MLLGERHKTLVGLATGVAACRHVRIVGPHELHVGEVHLFQLVKVGLPTVVFAQVIIDDLCTENLAQRCVGGVAGVGHQHFLAWVDKRQGYM